MLTVPVFERSIIAVKNTNQQKRFWGQSMAPPSQRARFAFILVIAATVAACGGGGGGSGSSGKLRVQIVNVSPDSPTLDFTLDGVRFTSLDFKESTARSQVDADAGVLVITADTPDGVDISFGPTPLGLNRDLKTTIVALGGYVNLSAVKIEVPDTPVPSGKGRVQLLHGAPVGPAVDIYITIPGAPITGSTPVARLDFGQFGASVDLDADLLQIQITERNQTTVLFDSGPFSLTNGDDLLIVVIDNTTTGPSPVSLLVQDDAGGSEILDDATGAEFRAVHASPVTGALDLRITPSFGLPETVFTNLVRGDVTDFELRDPDLYDVDFLFAGTFISAVDEDVDMVEGVQYTLYAANLPGNLDFFVTDDERRGIATEARLQIVHLAPTLPNPGNVGPIDVYVVPSGDSILLADPHLEDLVYEDIRTDYRGFAADRYDLVLTAANSKIESGPRQTFDLSTGDIYSVVIREDALGSPEYTFMDDF